MSTTSRLAQHLLAAREMRLAECVGRRQKKRWGQRGVAAKARVGHATVATWEKGALPQYRLLAAIARAYALDLDDLKAIHEREAREAIRRDLVTIAECTERITKKALPDAVRKAINSK